MCGEDTNASTIITSLVFYGTIGVVLMFIYECLRRNKAIYSPRCLSNKLVTPIASMGGFAEWISVAWSLTDVDTLEIVGMDAYILLRFLRMMAKVCIFGIISGGIVLFPVYATSASTCENQGINILAMGNLPSTSAGLWASWVITYLNTIVFLYFLYYEYDEFSRLRQDFFINPGKDYSLQTQATVKVENIPMELQSEVELNTFFNSIFPHEVHSVVYIWKTAEIEKVIQQREVAIEKFEKLQASFIGDNYDTKKEPKVKVTAKGDLSGCCGGKETPAIDYYKKRVVDLTDEIQTRINVYNTVIHASFAGLRNSSSPNSSPNDKNRKSPITSLKDTTASPEAGSTAFVTFKSVRTAILACEVNLLSENHPYMTITPAVLTKDIIWKNIHHSQSSINISRFFVRILLTLGVIFWGFLVSAFVSFVSNLSALNEYVPITSILPGPAYAVIAGLLPTIALSILISLLPTILEAIAKNAVGLKSQSEVEQFVCGWFYVYNIANVYLILFGSSAFGSISGIASNPTSVVGLLGRELPKVSVFFINFLLLQFLLSIPLFMIRLGPLIVNALLKCCTNPRKQTIRSYLIKGPLARAYYNYGASIPILMYFNIIVVLFWVIAPVVIGVGALFFSCAYICYKYSFVFVFVPRYETGGLFFYKLYRYTMISLLVSSLTILGFTGIKIGAAQAPLLVPLPIIIIFAWKYTSSKFYKLSMSMPLSTGTMKDSHMSKDVQTISEENGYASSSYHIGNFDPILYTQPAIRNDTVPPKVYPYRYDGHDFYDENNEIDTIYYDAMDGYDAADVSRLSSLEVLMESNELYHSYGNKQEQKDDKIYEKDEVQQAHIDNDNEETI